MIDKYAAATAALLIALAGAPQSHAADATGQKFMKEAIQGNLAEVKVGQLAQDKGASQAVKDFGATLVKDHGMANENATQAAQQMSVTPPGKPGIKEMAVYTKLAALSGDHFDHQFIKAMVKDHQEDVAKYQKEASLSGPAAAYAKQTLPKLREHLQMAQDLERGEKVASASKSSKMTR